MMEKAKTAMLIVLVALSLLQSYLLAYRMPELGATVRSDQDYVNAEPLGVPSGVESVIYPEELIIHKGGDKHTVLYPGTQFYDMILNQRLVGREFKGFQRSSTTIEDWEEVRQNDIGIELRFSSGISVDLLQKLLKLEGDLLFLNEKIDRIWIFKTKDTEEIRTFFFSSEQEIVYESVRADLTVRDVQDYVGFGQHLPDYQMTAEGIYFPSQPFVATEIVYPYEMYTPEQLQRSLFFDSSTTRAFEDRSGSLIFTDGKRGLKVEQNGMWISFTNPAAASGSDTALSENVYASVEFINQHGGWDGKHRLMSSQSEEEKKHVIFRKYIEQYPVIDSLSFHYGYMKLTLQQGVVTEYSRSTITLGTKAESRTPRWLQGGRVLEMALEQYSRREEVTGLFPAFRAMHMENNRLRFVPVWVVRLSNGTEEVLLEAYIAGHTPTPPDTSQDNEEAVDGTVGVGQSAQDESSPERSSGGMIISIGNSSGDKQSAEQQGDGESFNELAAGDHLPNGDEEPSASEDLPLPGEDSGQGSEGLLPDDVHDGDIMENPAED